ncbi:hypothetical protein EAE99_012355 [Botrytis elliptica]|nr:hypothetical protein EAE99_012355 [Botrytis elliptica]
MPSSMKQRTASLVLTKRLQTHGSTMTPCTRSSCKTIYLPQTSRLLREIKSFPPSNMAILIDLFGLVSHEAEESDLEIHLR